MEQLQVHLPKESVVASNSTGNAQVKLVNDSRMESGAENKNRGRFIRFVRFFALYRYSASLNNNFVPFIKEPGTV